MQNETLNMIINKLCERIVKVETKVDLICWGLGIIISYFLVQFMAFVWKAITSNRQLRMNGNGNGNGTPKV